MRVDALDADGAEPGVVITLRGQGFPAGRSARVAFIGTARRPGAEPRPVRVSAEGRALSEDRVELEVTSALVDAMGGRSTFQGDVRVSFEASGGGTVSGTLAGASIDFAAPTATRLSDEIHRTAAAADLARHLRLTVEETTEGLVVVGVERGAAEEAGLAAGDRIVEIDGVRLRGFADFVPPPGAHRTLLRVIRNGERVPVDVPVVLDGFAEGMLPGPRWEAWPPVLLIGVLVLLFLAPSARLVGWLARRKSLSHDALRPAPPDGARPAVASLLFAGPAGPGLLPRVKHVAAVTGMIVTTTLAFAALPLSGRLFAGGIDVGLLLLVVLACRAAVDATGAPLTRRRVARVVGRAAAEGLPAIAAVAAVMVFAGTTRLHGIVDAQGAVPWRFIVFSHPVAFVLFPAFVVSSLTSAHGGRRGALVQVAEHAWLLALSGLGAALFLGGWQMPGPGAVYPILGILLFLAKAWALLLLGPFVGRALERRPAASRLAWSVPVSLAALAGSAGWLLAGVPAEVAELSGPVLATASVLVLLYVVVRRLRAPRDELHLHSFL
jgi:NADH-quinone oxidoreductase subunit H